MSTAGEQIRSEITKHGAIPFTRFMELALYCPLCGYYEKKKDTPGRRGDYYTSVSVGPLFGELLAFQFAEWFTALDPQPATLHLVEAGAHDGQLARDILSWLQHRRPALFERLEYCILEPSPTRQAWQRETLAAFARRLHWHANPASALSPPPSSLGPPTFTVLFSNELLDAFPVHRLGWDANAQTWFEWGVTLERDQFVWTRLPRSSAIGDWPLAIASVLPDGFTTEICPAAESWWRDAATHLGHGQLLTFDYGLSAEEFFAPFRSGGTLRAYRGHRLADDPLAAPGEQDLTAHVNFTALQAAGEAAGLKSEAFLTQAQFLTGVAAHAWRPGSGFGDWTAERTRQFQTLTHPDFLGRGFRVLVQSRENP